MKRWYVYDEADCFASFSYGDSTKAMEFAADLTSEFDGVHVVCLTAAQAEVYNKTGDLRKAHATK